MGQRVAAGPGKGLSIGQEDIGQEGIEQEGIE